MLSFSSASPAAAGGVLPPTKVDLGTIILADGSGRRATGSMLMVGLNWATLKPRRTGFDIGIGYVGTFLPDPAERQLALRGELSTDSQLPSTHGGFLEVSLLAQERRHQRSWASGRVELLGTGGAAVWGLATRMSTELWSGFVTKGMSGAAMGVFAIGVWAELGIRGLPGGGAARHASAGLSVRIPAIAGH